MLTSLREKIPVKRWSLILAVWLLGTPCIGCSSEIGITYVLLLPATLLTDRKPESPAARFVLCASWGMAAVFISAMIPSWMIEGLFLMAGRYRVVMNLVCVAVVYGVFLVITRDIRRAVLWASTVLMLLGTLNGFIYEFRGNELKPLDFLSWRTAMNVVSHYSFEIPLPMVWGWLIWGWCIYNVYRLPDAYPAAWKKWARALALAAVLASTGVAWQGMERVTVVNWDADGTKLNGFFLNFSLNLRICYQPVPEGYSPEGIAQLEQAYPGQKAVSEEKPHILVIMNESFADFSVLGGRPDTDIPVTPFLDSLRENTIRGYAMSSVFGGCTANSEFEFLTGQTMAFLPQGSTPYQQYIHSDISSLPRFLQAQGYHVAATHPYQASGWNRPATYPRLGFADITFQEAYPRQDLIRGLVSDREMYRYVLDRLYKQQEPLFLFGITMQNHGGYDEKDYQLVLSLNGPYPQAQQYLSLLHQSDEALEEFLQELADFPEKTIVLFFGDHFPAVENQLYEDLYGGALNTLDEKLLLHKIPFFLWANYDIAQQEVDCTSLNYLGCYLLELAGLEIPPYFQFLGTLQEHIPSVSANGYYSLSQQRFLPISEAEGEEAQWLNLYEQLQYNSLFDNKHRSTHFFGS